MASPESTKLTPKSPRVQDSPVFNYLSNLSPLKPPDARGSIFLYGDASCPTPEPVFTSPHLRRRPKILKGSQQLGLSEVEKFCDNESPKLSEKALLTPSLLQSVKLVRCNIEKCDSYEPSYDQAFNSPSACVDSYFADPSKDCDNSSFSHPTSTGLPDLNSSQPTILPQYSISTREIVEDVNPCITTKASSNSSPQSEDNPIEDEPSVLIDLNVNEGDEDMVDENMKSNESFVHQDVPDYLNFLSKDGEIAEMYHEKAHPKHLSSCYHATVDSGMRRTETFQWGEPDYTPQPQSEVLQIVLEGDHKLDVVGTNPRKSSENHSQYGQEEVVQYQRGMRKRLQFESVSNCRITAGSKLNLCVMKSDVSDVESHGPSLDTETLNASSKEIALSSNKKLVESVFRNTFYELPLKVCSCDQNRGVSVVVPKPFSIDLHLNSIENIAAVNIKIDIHLTEEDVSAEVEKVVTTDIVQVKQYPKNLPPVRSLIGHQSAKLISSSDNSSHDSARENTEEKDTESHSIKISHHSASYQSSLDVKRLIRKLPLDSIDGYMTPCSMKRPSSENPISTLSSQKSPKKKRKMKDPPDNDGSKRCSCKRSKCLKLYCDCFAAGSCCSTACACLDCHNRPEHEGIILETRQLIESRNPLAFAPKVVVHAVNPPKGTGMLQDSEGLTPTSARHKRGCNCKKSQCLKKYCECYQAGVGCSLGCRCEGCKNTFGKKHGCDEIIEIEHKKSHKKSLERDPPVGKLEGIKSKRVDNSEHNYSRLSPLTPLLQSSSVNDASKLQLPAQYYPSPESGASVSPPFVDSPNPPVDSISCNMLVEEKGQTSSVVPGNQELGYRDAVPANSFSSGWDGFPDICKLGLLSSPSPQASDASASSKSRIPKTLQERLLQGSSHLPLGMGFCRSSPSTPQPRFGEGKFVKVPDSDNGLCKNQEDDTPEILQGTCSPIKSVTSPNLNEVKPRFSTGCKFILQSVPSFPPLSPYSNNTKDHGT